MMRNEMTPTLIMGMAVMNFVALKINGYVGMGHLLKEITVLRNLKCLWNLFQNLTKFCSPLILTWSRLTSQILRMTLV